MSIFFNADEVFEMGMDIEKNGEAYYRRAAELAQDPEVRAIFEQLMRAEAEHYKTFKNLRENLPALDTAPQISDPDDQGHLYLEALVKSRLFGSVREAEAAAAAARGPIETLRGALTFEKDTLLFFAEMQSRTREDLGRADIERLIEEERKHIVWISELIKKLRQSEA